ncbi:MAG: nucleotidyltransferase domain-containing protein [Deltaproteobacteria bacterium]|nr:nucleotidyltransferase domain-containing protein [Deltaproteobacteria bacterium]
MVVTPEGAARALVARAAGEQAALAARAANVRRRLPDVVRLLRQRFGAGRVILFGSLAWGGFHARSDTDLAVEGLPLAELGDAMAAASAAAGAVVEVFDLASLPPAFRQRVISEGEDLP